MAINLPLNAIQYVTYVQTPITGGNEYTTRFSTTDAKGQFVSVIHQSVIKGAEVNAQLTCAIYDGSPNNPRVDTTFSGSGSGLGSGWTIPVGGFQQGKTPYRGGYKTWAVVSSLGSNGYAAAYNSSESFIPDHTSQVDILATGDGVATFGPAVRMSTDGKTFYWLKPTPSGWTLSKVVNGTATTLLTGTQRGVVASLTILGPTLTVFITGQLVGTYTDASPIASGAPGVAGTGNVSSSPEVSAILISQGGMLGEETMYMTANVGTVDSQGRLPVIYESSSDQTQDTSTYLVSGGTNPAAGLTDHVQIANAWLRAKGVVS
jgi:hypothetical protein